MAVDVVRFVGDIVAIVISDDRATGADAAELVLVDYDPLPAVVGPEDAAKDEVLLFPEAGTNVAARSGSPEHDEKLFDGCDVVVSGTLVSQRMAPCPLEPRSAAAELGDDGRLTAWLSTQTPHQDRDGARRDARARSGAGSRGRPRRRRRLRREDAQRRGGACRLARAPARPARALDGDAQREHGRASARPRTAPGLHHRRDAGRQGARLPARRPAGRGAYPALGAFLPNLTALMASGVYAIPRIEFEGRSVVTNTTPISAFRGAGRPEATQAIERAIDTFAAELGMDPAEVRRRNFIPKDAFPYTTVTKAAYDSGDYEGALDLVLGRPATTSCATSSGAAASEGGAKQLGIGISCYVEITNGIAESEFGEVEITPDGGAIVRTGSFSHGQGHETTFAMIAAERLGLPVEKVTVHKGDTDEIAKGTGTYGSKSTQIGGIAARLAADDVVERAKQLVADYLEANPADIVLDLDAGRFHVVGAPEPALVGGPRLTRSGRRQARRADGGARVQGRPDLPVRRPRRRRRGRHGDRAGRAAAARRRRRRGHADQPADRGGPGARRRRDRRRAGALRAGRLRRGREPR